MKIIKKNLRKIVNKIINNLLEDHQEIKKHLRKLEEKNNYLINSIDELKHLQSEHSQKTIDLSKTLYEDIGASTKKLEEVRKTKDYALLYKKKEPLVSVRIATYNRGKILVEKAIKSVLAQTYDNYELIVIGDNCTDNTEELIKKLNKKNITFFNLKQRGRYPQKDFHRWLVAGIKPMNFGASLAKGDWIAPLDDDDQFTKDHIEILVKDALKNESEVSYGKFESFSEGKRKILGRYPPHLGDFTFQAAIYNSFLRFFNYDIRSWSFDEPGDWNLMRRMWESGVKVSFTDKVVSKIYWSHYSKKDKSFME